MATPHRRDGSAARIVQVGTPHEIYERPNSRFVADFIGIANILPQGDGRRWLALRPEKIALGVARPDAAHAVAGKIVDAAYEGDRSLYRVAPTTARCCWSRPPTSRAPRRRSVAVSACGWVGPPTPGTSWRSDTFMGARTSRSASHEHERTWRSALRMRQ